MQANNDLVVGVDSSWRMGAGNGSGREVTEQLGLFNAVCAEGHFPENSVALRD